MQPLATGTFGREIKGTPKSGASALESLSPGLLEIVTKGIPANLGAQTLTPDEQVRTGAALIRESLAAQLLERVRQATPGFFERLARIMRERA